MKALTWVEPAGVADAIAAGAEPGALFKAGGVDVLDLLKEHVAEPSALVNLGRVRELDFLREEKGALVLGPLVTLARVAADERILGGARALAQAAGAAATPQIRNLATMGGNLAQRPRCAYFRSELFHCRRKGGTECFAIAGENAEHAIFDNDLCAIVHPSAVAVALLALGATLKLQGPSGQRIVALEQFFVLPGQDVLRENVLKPGDLIVEIRVPTGWRSSYVKLMHKQSFDWPMAEAAVALDLAGGRVREARVAVGAVAPVPRRAAAVENALAGRTLAAGPVAEAAKLATQGATPLDKNRHKLPALQAAVERSLLAAAGIPS